MLTFHLPLHGLRLCIPWISVLGPDQKFSVLRPVVFGYIVGHPVNFGSPALSQGLVKLLPKLLQGLIICFTKS